MTPLTVIGGFLGAGISNSNVKAHFGIFSTYFGYMIVFLSKFYGSTLTLTIFFSLTNDF